MLLLPGSCLFCQAPTPVTELRVTPDAPSTTPRDPVKLTLRSKYIVKLLRACGASQQILHQYNPSHWVLCIWDMVPFRMIPVCTAPGRFRTWYSAFPPVWAHWQHNHCTLCSFASSRVLLTHEVHLCAGILLAPNSSYQPGDQPDEEAAIR